MSMDCGWSARQNTSGAKCLTWRTISGVSVGGSRLILPVSNAAARPTAKR